MVDHPDCLTSRSCGGIILPRLCDRTAPDRWTEARLGSRNSTCYLCAWTLDRRRGQYSDRAGARRDFKRFLSLAPRSRCQHDRPRYGGLYCKRLAEPFFLSASGYPQVTVTGVLTTFSFRSGRYRRYT